MGAVMLYPLWLYLYILAAHYVADFLAQSEWMASNKADSHAVLTAHVAAYALVMLAFCTMAFGLELAAGYVVINALFHWLIDNWTSQWSAAMHKAGRRRAFFNVIGFDQLLHQAILAVTLVPVIR